MFPRAAPIASLQNHYITNISARLHQACHPQEYAFATKGLGEPETCDDVQQLTRPGIDYTTRGRVQSSLHGGATVVDFRLDASDGLQLNRLQQAVLVSLHLTFLQLDDVEPGERYGEVWDRYMHDKGCTEPASLQQW